MGTMACRSRRLEARKSTEPPSGRSGTPARYPDRRVGGIASTQQHAVSRPSLLRTVCTRRAETWSELYPPAKCLLFSYSLSPSFPALCVDVTSTSIPRRCKFSHRDEGSERNLIPRNHLDKQLASLLSDLGLSPVKVIPCIWSQDSRTHKQIVPLVAFTLARYYRKSASVSK